MNLLNRCTIQRGTKANVDGKTVTTWANNATGVTCLFQEGRGSVRFRVEGTGALEYDSICFFEQGTDIKPQGPDDEKDRVLFTDPARLSGAIYLVQLVADESGTGRGYLTCYLKRHRGA